MSESGQSAGRLSMLRTNLSALAHTQLAAFATDDKLDHDRFGFDFQTANADPARAGVDFGLFAGLEGAVVDDSQPVVGRAGKAVEAQLGDGGGLAGSSREGSVNTNRVREKRVLAFRGSVRDYENRLWNRRFSRGGIRGGRRGAWGFGRGVGLRLGGGGGQGQAATRNPKSEIRNPKPTRKPNAGVNVLAQPSFRPSAFGFRISDFVGIW